jgi:shikimate kinase
MFEGKYLLMKNNIILIGFMGSGKSCVGEALAKYLSYSFYDTDKLLEKRAGQSISQIFEDHGEEYFRDMETCLLQDMQSELDQAVLSTGGGMPIRDTNSELLKKLGFVIYLKASRETAVKRLRHDRSRPLLKGDDLEERVDKLLSIRTPIYERAAHKIIVTDDKTINQIVTEIIDAWTVLIERKV